MDQILLHARPVLQDDEYCISFSALAWAAKNSEIHGGWLMSPIELSAAETKQALQQVALEDRRILSAFGQRFCLQRFQAPIGLGA